MIRAAFMLVAAFAMQSASAAGSEHLGDFAWSLPIEIGSRDGLYQIELSPAVHQGVMRPDLGDIRIFNGAGEVVPYAFRPRAEPMLKAQDPIALPLFPILGTDGVRIDALEIKVERRADGTVVGLSSRAQPHASSMRNLGYLLDTSALKVPLRALRFEWKPAAEGTNARVRIESSQTLAEWNTLVAAAPLVKLEFEGHRLVQNRVEFQPQALKYLRVSWAPGAQPLTLERVWAEPAGATIELRRMWRRVAAVPLADGPGQYRFDLGGYFPVDRVRFDLPQANTIAHIGIGARTRSTDAWRHIADSMVYRLTRDGSEVISPDITVASVTERYWRLKVDPAGGGIGTGTLTMHAGWIPQQIVFAARGEPPFRLAFGKREAARSSYPIATLVPGYKDDPARALAAAKLGELGAATGAVPTPAADAIDYRKLSLWSALVIAVLVLAAMAYRLVGQLGKPSGEAQDPAATDRRASD